MAILSDSKILKEIDKKRIVIEPFHMECLRSNSYDVHLSKYIRIYSDGVLDAKKENKTEVIEIDDNGFLMCPIGFYLGSTIEYTETRGFIPFLEGKSSTGRLGISIHETAGKGDDGFTGHWTLEITVKEPVRVYPGMPIGQIMYHTIEGEVLNPYNKISNAKYSNQDTSPIESKMWKNFGKDPFWK